MLRSLSRFSYGLLICTALVIASLIVSLIVMGRQGTAQASSATTVTLVGSGSAQAGEPVRLKLVVTGAQNLAGFQATVGFDSQAVRVLDAAAVEGLRGSGRDMLQFGPVRRENTVVFGAATCPVEDCASAQYRSAERRSQGVNGRVELGEVVLDVAAPGRYELRVDEIKLVDPQGNLLPAATTTLLLDVK